jgi:hypothetical protein
MFDQQSPVNLEKISIVLKKLTTIGTLVHNRIMDINITVGF